MAQVSKYRYLLNQYPETVQKEQFRIICHISKRTARYLLQSGLVPCVQSGKKTRNYTIKMKDIVRYLERREIHPEKYKLPPGSYSGTYAVKPLLPESVTTEELRKYYIESFRDIPDIVSTREAAELTGATASTVAKWIRTKKLKALSHGPAFIIPKVNLIDFIPMSTFVGGFPFASSGYNDGRGYYFAKDSNGGLVILDTWERGNDRTNSSFVIMGVAGIGKSTVVKHIMLSEYMKGTKILCIDPESEYKDMCRNLNGSWLNAGGGKNGRSNLLQIRPAPRDDDDETDKLYTDEGNGMSDMALHMKTLEIEFSLYLPSLTDMQKAILKQTIIELYNQFGIFWETDIRQLKATDFPILSDLHALLEKKAEANKENPVYRDLAMLLYDAAAGSDSFLWNGHTTLEANSRFICLDTHDLQNASDNVKRTQYLNLLSWCWEEMSRDRNERCLLVCDEAYLMIDPQVPQSLVFLRNVEKRARKYEAGLAIISHSVVDFLAPEVKMYGQALLDIPCYKILMGCDGKNLQETKDLYNLTDAEQELLESKRRGHALFIIGSKRLHVNFEIPAYKFSYMGKAGGR